MSAPVQTENKHIAPAAFAPEIRRLIREMSHQHSAPLLRVCQRFQPMMMRY
jgi:hypothetical protein